MPRTEPPASSYEGLTSNIKLVPKAPSQTRRRLDSIRLDSIRPTRLDPTRSDFTPLDLTRLLLHPRRWRGGPPHMKHQRLLHVPRLLTDPLPIQQLLPNSIKIQAPGTRDPSRDRGPGTRDQSRGQGPGARDRGPKPGPGTRDPSRDQGPKPGPGTQGPGTRDQSRDWGPATGPVPDPPNKADPPPGGYVYYGSESSWRSKTFFLLRTFSL